MISEGVRNRAHCQEVKSRRGGGRKVGRAPVTDLEGRCLVADREVESEGRINVKLQGSQEGLPVMTLEVKEGEEMSVKSRQGLDV